MNPVILSILVLASCAGPGSRIAPETAAMIAVRQVSTRIDPRGNAVDPYRAVSVKLSEGSYLVIVRGSVPSMGGTVRVWVDPVSGGVIRTIAEQ